MTNIDHCETADTTFSSTLSFKLYQDIYTLLDQKNYTSQEKTDILKNMVILVQKYSWHSPIVEMSLKKIHSHLSR